MEATVYFQRNGIRVTATQWQLPGRTIPISQLQGITLAPINFRHGPEWLCILLGLVLLLTEGALLMFGVFSLLAGLIGFFTTQPVYALTAHTGSRSRRVLTSHDLAMLQEICQAVEAAMAERDALARPDVQASGLVPE